MILRICAHVDCCKPFYSGGERFCSSKCATAPAVKRYIGPNCLECGKPRTGRQKSRVFCGEECSKKHLGLAYVRAWAVGQKSGSGSNGELRSVCKRYLLEQADWKCTWCGWCEVNEAHDKPTLTIDHIDGNWQNNKIDNLRVLCYNCHTLTPTFGSLNYGNPLVKVTRRQAGVKKGR